MLVAMMRFFEELRGTPVLLSVLAALLATRDGAAAAGGDGFRFPCNLYDLYRDVVAAVLRRHLSGAGRASSSKQSGPNPNKKSITRKQTSTHKGVQAMFTALFSC